MSRSHPSLKGAPGGIILRAEILMFVKLAEQSQHILYIKTNQQNCWSLFDDSQNVLDNILRIALPTSRKQINFQKWPKKKTIQRNLCMDLLVIIRIFSKFARP